MAKTADRARAQHNHLVEVANRIVVRAVFTLHARGWTADQIAAQLDLMVAAALTAVTTDAATNAEIDGATGEFTPESLDATIDVHAYAGHLVDEVCKGGE
jgi:transcriptional regulator